MSPAESFSRPGAVDLSTLAQQAAGGASQPVAGTAHYAVEVNDENFNQIVHQSTRYPVVVLLESAQDPACRTTKENLTALVNAMDGQILLAICDIDRSPRIAQAFAAQAVPTVVAIIAGQIAPLFQGTKDPAEIKAVLDQIHQVAIANGLSGRAEPQASAVADGVEQESHPRFAKADEALQRGDYQEAIAEFDALLKANPADREAQAGKIQTELLARTSSMDIQTLNDADANPDDIEANLAAADMEILAGRLEGGFARLLRLIRSTTDDERERIRQRLVDLFSTCDPNDPAVKKARRELAMVLF